MPASLLASLPAPSPAAPPTSWPAAQSVYRFGVFELRSTERVLLRQGQAEVLGSRALQVLLALVARGGELLTKDELLQAAWPGLVVEEANVHVAVSQLRKVLGKAAIATVAGLGYRFALPLLAAPALATPTARPQLPVPRTAFVGRVAELRAAAQQLRATRLLTVVGMGGMGKTRLALQLAQNLQHQFADGAFFVDLAPVLDGSAVPGAVLRALGLPAAGSATAAATTAALVAHLHSLQVLLVLDNCEHQLHAVLPLVAALAAGANSSATIATTITTTTVLATSRQPLAAPGESCFVLRPLQLTATEALVDAPASASTSVASDAQQLFMQRVLADTPGFVFDEASAPLVATICRRLDGIPLALELAAARMKMLSLQQLHGLLQQRFELLTRGAPGAAAGTSGVGARQQTLQDVLQWSWEHLAAPEQALAQAVAVCGSGFDLDTAVALCPSADQNQPVAVLDSLAQLADRALIHVTHGTDAARYGMLETVREYLLAQAARSGQLAAARQRHRAHFHALALRAEQATASGTDSARWAAKLDAERDNLMAALVYGHQHGGVDEGLQMVAALKNFWFASGWLEQGLQAAHAALARVPADAPTRLSARVHRLAAQLCLFMSRLDEGAVHARLALAQAQTLGDDAAAASALCFAGRIAVKGDDTTSGEQLLMEGLRRARIAGDLAVVGEALNALAFAAIERDDLGAAETHFSEALLASQQRGSALGHVIETLNLAWVSVMNAGAQPQGPGEHQGPRPHHGLERAHQGLDRARQRLLSVWHTLHTMPHRYVAQELVDVCASFALQAASVDATATGPIWYHEAAVLHAASAAQRLAIHLPLTAKQAAHRASEATAVHLALGEAAYAGAAEEGRLQTHDQTLARLGGWLQAGPVLAPPASTEYTAAKSEKPKTSKTKQPV